MLLQRFDTRILLVLICPNDVWYCVDLVHVFQMASDGAAVKTSRRDPSCTSFEKNNDDQEAEEYDARDSTAINSLKCDCKTPVPVVREKGARIGDGSPSEPQPPDMHLWEGLHVTHAQTHVMEPIMQRVIHVTESDIANIWTRKDVDPSTGRPFEHSYMHYKYRTWQGRVQRKRRADLLDTRAVDPIEFLNLCDVYNRGEFYRYIGQCAARLATDAAQIVVIHGLSDWFQSWGPASRRNSPLVRVHEMLRSIWCDISGPYCDLVWGDDGDAIAMELYGPTEHHTTTWWRALTCHSSAAPAFPTELANLIVQYLVVAPANGVIDLFYNRLTRPQQCRLIQYYNDQLQTIVEFFHID